MLNYNFMISSSKISPFGEGGRGGLKRTQNGCWEIDAGAKLGYCMRNERRGCLFSIYSALHHLLSANPLAAIRTSDHAVSLTSAWITAECVCVCEWVFVRTTKRGRERAMPIPPSETLLNIHWQLFRFDQGAGWCCRRERERSSEEKRVCTCVHVCMCERKGVSVRWMKLTTVWEIFR